MVSWLVSAVRGRKKREGKRVERREKERREKRED